ncbi:hypothetical protein Daus18300_010566 [Diaporthe australafricana]|uniref:MARVEL domain-containing protein n=1 Tax=Diaporthe australafricana TaxID=127596 RepID=A0ABR3W9P7_9PEZI
MILTDLVAMIFRLAELAFAAIVAGITGDHLHASRGQSSWSLGRFIYAEVVAGLSILLALLWLLPFSGSFVHWPVDLVISFAWFAVFGLLVDWLGGSCGSTFDWSGIGLRGNDCGSWKADEAFAFLSAICWLVSALIGIYWVRRHTATGTQTTKRRRWHRSRV